LGGGGSALRETGAAGLGKPSRALPSSDGRALLVNVPIVASGNDAVLVHDVDVIRKVLERTLPKDLEAKVTGPAGLSADASRVFDGINSTLLYSAALLVFVLLVIIYRSPIFWVLPLLAVFFAEGVVRAFGYLLAQAGVVINGQVGGILLVSSSAPAPTTRSCSRLATARSSGESRASTRRCGSRCGKRRRRSSPPREQSSLHCCACHSPSSTPRPRSARSARWGSPSPPSRC
jgi:hypothetical protein